ncbi:internal scaffolding protein [Microvirus D_HF4_340]|nr:internal scaffolding protein [Microvirus D_HF4_340]
MPKKIVTDDGEIRDADDTTIAIAPPFWKTPYNHDTLAESMRTATRDFGESKTQQSQADEADLNKLLQKYGIGVVRELAPMPPVFDYDVPEIIDMQEAIRLVRAGQDAFDALPAEIRAQFDNDLARYSGFVDARIKEGDVATLKKLGIAVPDPPVTEATPPKVKPEATPPK